MPYSIVPVMATGDWITAGWVNTYIGGNMAAMWPGTTVGDMEYYISNVAKARLAIGSAGSILKSTGSAPAWLPGGAIGSLLHNSAANTPAWLAKGAAYQLLRVNSGATNIEWGPVGKAYGGGAVRSTNQSIPNAAYTVVNLNGELWDSGTVWTSGANATKLIAPITGKYLVSGYVAWETNSANIRECYIRQNGTLPIFYDSRGAVSGAATRATFSTLAVMNASDYVELVVWQNSGGNLNVLGTESRISIVLLGE